MSSFQVITTGADEPTLKLSPERQQVKGHQYLWLAGGNGTFLEMASMVVSWWIVAFLRSAVCKNF